MKLSRIRALLIIVATLPAFVAAQTSRVHTTYSKDRKLTKVETSALYLVNSPEQFIQLTFESVYKGEKLDKPVDKVDLSVFSLAKKARYRGPSEQTLYAVTDGERWKVGTVLYLAMNGETKNGKDAFYSENNKNLGIEVPFPQTAKVRNGSGDVNGLTMEWLDINMKANQFAKIATAKKVEFQLGSNAFELDETHMAIISEFLAKITPGP